MNEIFNVRRSIWRYFIQYDFLYTIRWTIIIITYRWVCIDLIFELSMLIGIKPPIWRLSWLFCVMCDERSNRATSFPVKFRKSQPSVVEAVVSISHLGTGNGNELTFSGRFWNWSRAASTVCVCIGARWRRFLLCSPERMTNYFLLWKILLSFEICTLDHFHLYYSLVILQHVLQLLLYTMAAVYILAVHPLRVKKQHQFLV